MNRYRSIYLPLDNSPHSLRGVDLAIALAGRAGARLTGSHVYAARLHDRRFRQMEGGLPEPYRKEEKLTEQRDIHDDLITRGLEIISDSFLDVFEERCRRAGLACRNVTLEGKNWQRLVEDIGAGDYDLVVMGALGLGAVESSQLGSVCERVARRIDRDLLVVREPAAPDENDLPPAPLSEEGGDGGSPLRGSGVNAAPVSGQPVAGGGAIVVALDGSPHSYGGLKSALELGRIFSRPVEAVAAFDPDFHYVAFNSIARVLSPEAAGVFRFKEQEKLHEEIIDSGLAKIYQGHLDVAMRIAAEEGVELRTRLLAGKPFEQLLRYARETMPWLMVLGRIGVHSEAGMDLGGATENLLRLAPCNLLLSARVFEPPLEHIAETTMAWTEEAEARMARVPEFARGMARKAVVKHAVERGHTVVTSDVIDDCLFAVMPTAARGVEPAGSAPGAGKCPFAHRRDKFNLPAEQAGAESTPPAELAFDGETIAWEPAALSRIGRITDEALRAHAKLRIEKMARRMGQTTVTESMVDAAARTVYEMMG